MQEARLHGEMTHKLPKLGSLCCPPSGAAADRLNVRRRSHKVGGTASLLPPSHPRWLLPAGAPPRETGRKAGQKGGEA